VKQHLDSFNFFVDVEIKKIVQANAKITCETVPNFRFEYTGWIFFFVVKGGFHFFFKTDSPVDSELIPTFIHDVSPPLSHALIHFGLTVLFIFINVHMYC
jgi:hypothetical protein